MSHPPLPFVAVVVRLFVLRPADPNRASGEGKDGSDPPFCAAVAARRRGGVSHGVRHRVSPPLAFGEVAPVCMYPCRKAPRPARGPDDKQRRAARCVTDASARSCSSAASVSRPPGRGQARFPRPIPWRCSSATTPRTCTAPSSRGTTSRPAWPCSWPGNSSSVRGGSGSPGWASVWGSGPAFRRGAFAFGGRAGHRRRRGPSPGQSHREPGSRMAADPGAGPLYRRGDCRRGRVRQNVGVYAPVRAPTPRLASGQSRAARRRGP